jgi:hypothetical protein
MHEVTQPRRARGTLTVALVATALLALLAFAPLASATPDPVASGTTTVKLEQKLTKELRPFGIKISALKPAKLKGRTATFAVTGGSFDPTTNAGTLTHSGGLKVTWGKKSVSIRALEINTSKKGLFGKVAGKKMKIAQLAGASFAREGFGVKATIKKLKLTGNAAVTLDKKLNPATPAKSKGKKKGKGQNKKGGNGASKSDAIPAPFKANALLGSATASEQPSTVTLLPANNLIFEGSSALLTKLSNVKANVEGATGTTFSGAISGGTLSPTATGGTVQSNLGLKLVQKLPTQTGSIDTTITLGNWWLDLSAKTVNVEVSAESNAESPAGSGKKPLNLGALGRSSIADLTVTGVIVDPTTRTVNVSSSAVLQAVSAEVLQGFVSVYKPYIETVTPLVVCQQLPGKCATDPEKALAAQKGKEEGEKAAQNEIKSGESLGSFRFTAQGQ